MARKNILSKPSRAGATVEFRPIEVAIFEMLTDFGIYGKTPQAVARYLVRRQIDDLTRAGVLKPGDIAASAFKEEE